MHRIIVAGLSVCVTAAVFSCGSSTDDHLKGGGAGQTDAGGGSSVDGSTSGSSGKGGGFPTGAGGASSGAGGTGAGAGGTAGKGGASGSGGLGSVTPIGGGTPCVDTKVQAAAEHLDIFIMLDRSLSMADATAAGGSKWTVITQAIGAFVNDKASAGIGAGIAFFGIPTGGGMDSSCTVSDYATPVVPIAALNGNAAAITTAIQGVAPATNTPTEPALQGALTYAEAWAKKNPTHKVVVVFATDGLPNGCNSTIPGAAQIATTGRAATDPVNTYVIGVFGSKDCPNGLTQNCMVVTNTNAIAKGGGTGTAFIVDTGGNTESEFVSAMNAIRTANNVGCDYAVPKAPTGKTIDLSRASVLYTASGKAAASLKWFKTAAACGTSAGWYYSGAKIELCKTTCSAVEADPLAKIEIELACGTNPPPGAGGATGAGGTGAGGTGAGGTGNGGTAGSGGAAGSGGSSCLLNGQSCATDGDCCGGLCISGVCGSIQ